MAPKDDQAMDDAVQSNTKPMELRPKNNSTKNNDNDEMDTSQPESNEESSSEDSDDDEDDSSSDSEEEEEEEKIATLKPGTKPDFSARIAAGAPSLEDRLKAFLPQLAEANDLLGKGNAKEHSMEDVGDDEPHIEMSLGLGLLEEKNGKEGEGQEESDSEDDEGMDGSGEDAVEKKRKEKDVMGKLMGGRENQAAGIEEVG